MSSTAANNPAHSNGQRSRIIAPTPPAPVPEERKRTASLTKRHADRSTLKSAPPGSNTAEAQTSDTDVVRSTGSMAIATLLSRITGFLRAVMITSILGAAIASAFNTANTLPNLITEIVLGAVLTSLVVPVLVRAEKEDPDRGSAFFRRLLTLSITLLGGVTILSIVGAPILTRIMLKSDGEVNVVMSTAFAYWLLPQIFFYGLFALFMAVLNTREIFKPGAWAPVVNNIISLIVLLGYRFVPGRLEPDDVVSIFDPHVMLLGIGTTLGVVIQCLIMVPYLRRAGIDLRPLWGIDARLKQFGGMALAIIVYVAISQAGYVVTTRIASIADEAAPIIYQQHWLLLQVPYGIIGVTLLTAIMPRLSRNAANGDDRAVVSDLALGSKLTFIALIPIVVFFTVFGVPIANALFAWGEFSSGEANILGWTLSFSAFTLIPYALVLLHLRVFYAREDAWTPTFIIAGITATKIVLSLAAPLMANSTERVVVLLGAANGFGFIAGAVIGAYLLRKKLGALGMRSLAITSAWALGAAGAGAGLAWMLGWVIQTFFGDFLFARLSGSFGYLLFLCVMGLVFLIATGLVLSRSRLPEVQNVGKALARVPGMHRFIRPDEQLSIDTGSASEQEISRQIMVPNEFAATPVPPPLSAGIVRGPRLVPGAPVSGGRFRLLADHGGVPGARFWHAREIATGGEVALIFVDTSGNAPYAPVAPSMAEEIAQKVQERTTTLANLGSPAIANNIRTETYRNGCMIVADWIPGSALSAVVAGADPRAASFAMADLTDAAAAAHRAGIPLGLDNKSRIRINSEGHAMLAFPAVLPESSRERDAQSVAAAVEMLIDTTTAPDDVALLCTDAHLIDPANPDTFTEVAQQMRHCGLGTVNKEPVPLAVRTERTPKPERQSGFGASDYSPKMMASIALAVFVLVSLVAAVTAFLSSLFGSSEESPLTNVDSGITSSAPAGPAVYLPLAHAHIWNAGPGESVPEIIDANRETSWISSGSEGVLISLDQPAKLSNIVLSPPSTSDASINAEIKLYAFTTNEPTVLSQGIEIGTMEYSSQVTSHSIDSAETIHSMVLWVEKVESTESDSPELAIAEVELVGW